MDDEYDNFLLYHCDIDSGQYLTFIAANKTEKYSNVLKGIYCVGMDLLSSSASPCPQSSPVQPKEPPYRVNHYIPTPTLIDYPHTKAASTVNPALDADCCGRTVTSAFKSAFILCICTKEISICSMARLEKFMPSRSSA